MGLSHNRGGNITYERGKTRSKFPHIILRGKGLQDAEAKAILRAKNFAWIEKSGMRRVMGWKALMPVSEQAVLIQKLQDLGYEVKITSKMGAKELPPTSDGFFKMLGIVPGKVISHEKLIGWLESNGYTRLSQPEKTGDFSVQGATVTIFSYGTPARKVRLEFDGEKVEAINQFRTETKAWHALSSVRFYGKGA